MYMHDKIFLDWLSMIGLC